MVLTHADREWIEQRALAVGLSVQALRVCPSL